MGSVLISDFGEGGLEEGGGEALHARTDSRRMMRRLALLLLATHSAAAQELVQCEYATKIRYMSTDACEARKRDLEATRSNPGALLREREADVAERQREVDRIDSLPVDADVLKQLGAARQELAHATEALERQKELESLAADEKRKDDAKSKSRKHQQTAQAALIKANPDKDPRWLRSRSGQIWARHQQWSPAVCDRLANRELWLGMTPGMVIEAFGKPGRRNETNTRGRITTQWVYPAAYLYFENGTLSSWQVSR